MCAVHILEKLVGNCKSIIKLQVMRVFNLETKNRVREIYKAKQNGWDM